MEQASRNKAITGALLAAGASTRFGDNKLLHPLSNGVPMVLESARRLLNVLPNSVAVVSDRNGEVAELLQNIDMTIVVNEEWRSGMGRSVAKAIEYAANADAWMICLGDMPYISKDTYEGMLAAYDATHGRRILAPSFQGQRGHPVVFSRHFMYQLSSLNGDYGARSILATNTECIVTVEMNDSGVVMDIDCLQDLNKSLSMV